MAFTSKINVRRERPWLVAVLLAIACLVGCSAERGEMSMAETERSAESGESEPEAIVREQPNAFERDRDSADPGDVIGQPREMNSDNTGLALPEVPASEMVLTAPAIDLPGLQDSATESANTFSPETNIARAPEMSLSMEMAAPMEMASPRRSTSRMSMPAETLPEEALPAETLPTSENDPGPDEAAAEESHENSIDAIGSTGPFATLPAGATHDPEQGFATVAVYYATDRQRDSVPLSAYNITGNRDAVVLLGGSAIVFLVLAGLNLVRRRVQIALGFGAFGSIAAMGASVVLLSATASIEKRGVTYNADRGSLVKGIAEVTVPDNHQRGSVERPSLLRFEIREDQQEHIVLTSAIELSDAAFHQRLAETVALSPNQDLLVFIHGYNVDFESAVQRTAQIAVDLPFEGVPVCYSWPSQGTLFGYTVDETNAAWTQTHLKKFLLDLASESGARSINVVAHSMGNRPATGALVEIGWQLHSAVDQDRLFDRVVLAAPDVDADQFRRDLAPALTAVADHVTLYASSDDKALIASKQVHGYPRAGESGEGIVVVPGIETVDVSGIDLSLLGHSYYGDNQSMLQDLYQVVRSRLPAKQRRQLAPRPYGELTYWQLIGPATGDQRVSAEPTPIR